MNLFPLLHYKKWKNTKNAYTIPGTKPKNQSNRAIKIFSMFPLVIRATANGGIKKQITNTNQSGAKGAKLAWKTPFIPRFTLEQTSFFTDDITLTRPLLDISWVFASQLSLFFTPFPCDECDKTVGENSAVTELFKAKAPDSSWRSKDVSVQNEWFSEVLEDLKLIPPFFKDTLNPLL